MKVFRLVKEKYKNDLSGFGAEKFGGRWNNKGTRIVYTSQSRALAKLEVAVHVTLQKIPKNYYLVTLEIPDEKIFNYNEKKLKDTDWKSNPPVELTQAVGDEFVNNNKNLILKVPSAIVQGDFNFLINPLHKDFNQIKIVKTEAFEFDERLFL